MSIRLNPNPNHDIPICPDCAEPLYFDLVVFAGTMHEHVTRKPRACECERTAMEERRQLGREEQETRIVAAVRGRWQMDREALLRQTFMAWDHARQPSMQTIWEKCRMWAQGFAARRPRTGILLAGSVNGTGKSHLLNAIANYVCDTHRLPAVAGETAKLLDILREAIRSATAEAAGDRLMGELLTCPLLVLNDLAAAKDTEWRLERIFRIVSDRIEAGLPTCVSMNENPRLWGKQAVGLQRIASRLEEACDFMIVDVLAPEAVDYRRILREMREEQT